MPLFMSPRIKIKSKSSQLVYTQRQNTSLFGCLYIANQQRAGRPSYFLWPENQTTSPSLSDNGKIRLGQKSKLLSCLEADNQSDPPRQCDCKIFVGAAVVHLLPTAVYMQNI